MIVQYEPTRKQFEFLVDHNADARSCGENRADWRVVCVVNGIEFATVLEKLVGRDYFSAVEVGSD